MIQTVREHLTSRGITSNYIGQDQSLLAFSMNNINYLFSYNQNEDPYFVRLMIPNIADFDRTQNQELNEAVRLSSAYKVGKVIVIDNTKLWIVVDAFVYSRETINLLFDRLVTVANDMLNDFRTHENGEREG